MTERQELWLLLGILYLAECFRWVRRGSWVFRRLYGSRWSAQPASEFIGNDRGDLHWAWPFPLFGDLIVARGLPWCVGPEGVATWHPVTRHPNGRTLQAAGFRRWEEVREVQLEGEKIFVANELWWVADSQVEAQRLASALKRWAELPAKQREAALRIELRDSFDVAAVRARIATTPPELGLTRQIASGLWCVLFFLLPLAIWRQGWFPALPLGLIAVYGLGGWIAWRTVRLHQTWYPRATAERLRVRLLCWCSPLTAIRAADLVGRNRVESFDPLAVALALLPGPRTAAVAGSWVRDSWFPRLPENPFPHGTPAANTVTWFTSLYQEIGTEALKTAGIDAEALRRPPAATEACHTQYCARCQAQYLAIASSCQACNGRPLYPLVPVK